MKETEVINPSKVVRTDYLSENMNQNLKWLVNQTKELDKTHGKPDGSLSEGDVVTFQCKVHDNVLARLLMMPLLQSHNGRDPIIGLSIPGFDVEMAVREPLDNLVKAGDGKVEVVEFLKGKLDAIEELRHQSEPAVDLPDEQLSFILDNADGAERLIRLFIDELSSTN